MANLVFDIRLHYDTNKLNEPDTRQRVEEALNMACAALEKNKESIYIGYKIHDITDLEPSR